MNNPHLNPELTGSYRVVNTHLPVVLQSPIGDIDFRTLTEAQAALLVSKGFYYLECVFTLTEQLAQIKSKKKLIEVSPETKVDIP